MIITWQGKPYAFEPGNVTVREATTIKLHTGHGLISWQKAIWDADPQSVAALMWLVKARNGEAAEIAMLDFDVMAFLNAYGEAVTTDLATAAAADAAPKADSGDLPTSTPTPTSGDPAPST